MEVVYYSLDFPGAISLHDALYESRKIGSYEVTPLQFTSTDGELHGDRFSIDLAILALARAL